VSGAVFLQEEQEALRLGHSAPRRHIEQQRWRRQALLSFFYWGMLIGCGDCRNVHPAGVGGTLPAEEKQRRERARAAEQGLFEDVARSAPRGGRHSGWDKEASGGGGADDDEDEDDDEEDEEEDLDEMRQMVREVHILRLEGSQREADLLDKEIKRRRQEQLERVRNR
jgi:hypothetical protein